MPHFSHTPHLTIAEIDAEIMELARKRVARLVELRPNEPITLNRSEAVSGRKDLQRRNGLRARPGSNALPLPVHQWGDAFLHAANEANETLAKTQS